MCNNLFRGSDVWQKMRCAANASATVRDSCDCQMDCSETIYETTTSMAKWPSPQCALCAWLMRMPHFAILANNLNCA